VGAYRGKVGVTAIECPSAALHHSSNLWCDDTTLPRIPQRFLRRPTWRNNRYDFEFWEKVLKATAVAIYVNKVYRTARTVWTVSQNTLI